MTGLDPLAGRGTPDVGPDDDLEVDLRPAVLRALAFLVFGLAGLVAVLAAVELALLVAWLADALPARRFVLLVAVLALAVLAPLVGRLARQVERRAPTARRSPAARLIWKTRR